MYTKTWYRISCSRFASLNLPTLPHAGADLALVVWYNLTTASSPALSWDVAVTRMANECRVLLALIVLLGSAHLFFTLRHWNKPREVRGSPAMGCPCRHVAAQRTQMGGEGASS